MKRNEEECVSREISKESRRSVGVGGIGGASASERPAMSRTGVSVKTVEPAALRQFGWYREFFVPWDEGLFL